MRRVLLAALLVGLGASFTSVTPDGFRSVYEQQGNQSEHTVQLKSGALHSFTCSIISLTELQTTGPVRVRVKDKDGTLFEKTLFAGDADFYSLFRARSEELRVELDAPSAPLPRYNLNINEWLLPPDPEVLLEAEPNDSWLDASRIELGKTVWATSDDVPYLPLESAALEAGADWYGFEFNHDTPQLVFFGLELLDRDNIPADIQVFRQEGDRLVAWEEGLDPVTPPHEVQALHGNKFTTRVLRGPAKYYLRALARHPWYQLKTFVYTPPPYRDPRQAVRVALDYLLGAGDSWHANTPRKGGVFDRIANYHHETSLCVACHPTHFPMRAQLYALRNGYPIRQRPQLLFLSERFYNNPLPFYGHSDGARPAAWTRVISSSANVLGRMAALLGIFERELSHEPRNRFFAGIGEYLKLYYKGREELPPDETNGNLPLVSNFEVAWYSWEVFAELYRRTGDAEYAWWRDHVRRLLEGAKAKNLIDLGYQTLALCAIDRQAYAHHIQENCRRILSFQRPTGQWAATFEPHDPEAEFQTGHCVWTLAVAGYTADHPSVKKAVNYLLSRQQNFGGWFDPAQSYENFRTPFRETQMAVLALSTLYPQKSSRGWGVAFPPVPRRLGLERPDLLLSQLDNLWEPPQGALLEDVLKAACHPEPLVRQSALACLGRVSDSRAVPTVVGALGDSSKVVQRTAAWAARQIYSRKNAGGKEISLSLSSPDDRVRWGASRIFAGHFSELAKNTTVSTRLVELAADPVFAVRLQALKGLWQLWYWSADPQLKDRIEGAFMARLQAEEHPQVLRNVKEGLYILADENIRYLYNNWIPLLGAEADRDRAVLGRLAEEERLAGKIARALQSEDARLRRNLLEALSDFHLRSPQSYQLPSPVAQPATAPRSGGVYTRIGNDIETVKFFGPSADLVTRALFPLLRSEDVELRRLAARTAFTAREDRLAADYGATRKYGLADVLRLAGSYEPARRTMAEEMLRLVGDEDQQVRQIARDVRRFFTVEFSGEGKVRVALLLGRLLESPYAEARSEALKVIAGAGEALQEQSELAAKVREAFLAENADSAAFLALLSFPPLLEERDVRMKIFRSLASSDLKTFQAAVELGMNAPQLEKDAMITRRFNAVFTSRDPQKKKSILDLAVSKPHYLKDLRLISLISDALVDQDSDLSGAALSMVRKEKALQELPAIAEALARRPEQAAAAKVKLPDYQFFKEQVQPILEVVGKDGNACVNCHQTHSILRLNPPPAPSATPDEQILAHYRAALRVVSVHEPEESLILRKPTSSAEAEGTLSTSPNSHGGGIRWEKNSPEYRTILEWILTARP